MGVRLEHPHTPCAMGHERENGDTMAKKFTLSINTC